ncbi:MAG: prolyl oligopeptidase family serine peptidase [Acidobacteria bacterium]|nr:prolyl oligopeptidase family serine peptidase [Acidobacteriota bacterium]
MNSPATRAAAAVRRASALAGALGVALVLGPALPAAVATAAPATVPPAFPAPAPAEFGPPPSAPAAHERPQVVEPAPPKPTPPHSTVREVVDTLHGVEVRDPYRWLEDQDAPATRTWIDAQNAYTDAVLHALPGRGRLRELAAAVLERGSTGVPIERGGRYFYHRRRAGEELSVIRVRDGIDGDDRVLVDPHPLSPDHTTSVALRDVSEDGALVAYAVRAGGVDEVSIRVRDVETGADLPDVLPPARYHRVHFAAGARGLYYDRYGDVSPRVMYHAFGTPVEDDPVVFEGPYDRGHIPDTVVSDDGAWMAVQIFEGSYGPIAVHVKDLRRDGPFVTAIDDPASESAVAFAGHRLVFVTSRGAPNRRVMLADPARPTVDSWRESIPERDDVVLRTARGRGGRLVVSYLQDGQPRAAVHDLEGAHVRDIAFDAAGSVAVGGGRWSSPEAFVTFQTFHVPRTVYRYDLESGDYAVWARPELPLAPGDYEVARRWYRSKDGTRVPLWVAHRSDVVLDGRNPTLLTGYGGFGYLRPARFSSLATVWLAAGGVYALANLRGGGEFGQAWHEAGRLGNKQNVFDDFIAAAEHLIEAGFTRPEHLAIRGASNGGLLVAAVSNQRPDLFGAVVSRNPLLDMLRYHRFLAGPFWVPEYGSSDDPEQFAFLRAYSPYHNAVDGGDYPATLYVSGDGDTRVAPLHARKMTALLQARSGSGRPVLLRYHAAAGHSGGQPVSRRIDELVDTLGFLLWQVGGEKTRRGG